MKWWGWIPLTCIIGFSLSEIAAQDPGKPMMIQVGGEAFQKLTDLNIFPVMDSNSSMIRATGKFSGITFIERVPDNKRIIGVPFSQSDIWGLQYTVPGNGLKTFEFFTIEDHLFFPGGPAIAGTEDLLISGVTITSSGNVDPDFSKEGQILSDGISNAVYPVLDLQMNLLGYQNFGGSGRVDARDISIARSSSPANWMATGTFTGTVDIPGTGSGKQGSDVITLSSEGAEDCWVAYYGDVNCVSSFCELLRSEHIKSKGGVFPFIGRFDGSKGADGEGSDNQRSIVAGYYESPGTAAISFSPSCVRYGSGGTDGFVVVYAPPEIPNAIVIGGPGEDAISGLSVDGSGNIYITGYFTGTMDIDPGDPVFPLTSRGERDLFLAKFDRELRLLWANSLGSNGMDEGAGISVSEEGIIYLTGRFNHTVNFDFIGQDPGYELNSHGGSDIFMAAYETDGSPIFAYNFGSAGEDLGTCVELDENSGRLVLGGTFSDSVDFDPVPGIHAGTILKSGGSEDVFIAIYPMGFPSSNSLPEIPDIEIYPNPSNGIIYLKGLDISSISNITLWNNQGSLIFESGSGTSNRIDVPGVPQGIYILQLISERYLITKKVLIQ